MTTQNEKRTKDRQKKRLERELKDAQDSLKWNREFLANAEKQYKETYERKLKRAEEKIKELGAKLVCL